MTTAAVQTIWADVACAALADAGVELVVVSPGSRSTPLVAALVREPRLARVTIIDERVAAFYALGAARATGVPAALVCTSGSAAAHYLPALVEASHANIPLVVLTADRPPELHACGASQTIDQRDLYGRFVRAAFDLGAPHASEAALRGVRRTIIQAVTRARGGNPGPVHVDVPLRKPLEPAPPATDAERALARTAAELRGRAAVAPPRLVADDAALDELARTIAREPDGVIVAGAMPAGFTAARDDVFALAVRAGYPVIAEAGSQLRLCPRERTVACVDHFDLIPVDDLPVPKVIVQLGAEPVAAGWSTWLGRARAAERYVLAGPAWHDPEGTARVILGDERDAIARVLDRLEREPAADRTPSRWAELEARAAHAAERAIDAHARSETAVVRAAIDALPAGALVQIGNSLPIRVVDHVAGARDVAVITQRGAAGIDGLIASAAGATRAGKPVLLVLGDVSFAHDVGGLLAARTSCTAPLAVVVVDNRGGQIFAGLPVARAELQNAERASASDVLAEHWLTPPGIDPAAVATAMGLRSVTAASAAAVASAVSSALAEPAVTVIHAPVSTTGAHDVRRTALELFRAGARRAREDVEIKTS